MLHTLASRDTRRDTQGESPNMNAFLQNCRDASTHIDISLSNDASVPARWPFDCSPSPAMYKKVASGPEGAASPGLQQARLIPFPPSLIERHHNSPVDYWRMGIFPEICRVWVVLEHRLYLWNYMESGSTDVIDLETPLQERIFGVGLVRPPRGVFNENVQWVLVVVTPSYVLLHQVVFSTAIPHDEIKLVPTDYFVKSDDLCGVGVPHPLKQPKVRIISTESGRVFLCGQDSTVHEFLYPKDASYVGGWIPSSKCRKVSHYEGWLAPRQYVPPVLSRLVLGDDLGLVDVKIDDSRKRLYTLAANAWVTIYDISGPPNSTAKVVAKNFVKPNRGTALPGQVVGLSIIPLRGKPGPHDRSQPEFVVFLAYGVCISYRVNRSSFSEVSQIAPDNSGGDQAGGRDGDVPMQVNTCLLSGDLVLMAHDGVYMDRPERAAGDRSASEGYRERNDAILHCVHATGHDLKRALPGREQARAYALSQHPLVNSGVLALAEVPMELIVPRKLWKLAETEWSLPELASQPWLASMISDDGRDASRWILALSKAGLHCFVKTRPIDQIRSVLSANQLSNDVLLKRPPLDLFSQTELYSMCLQIACSELPLGGGGSGNEMAGIRGLATELFTTDPPERTALDNGLQQQQQLFGSGGGGGWGQQPVMQQPVTWGTFGAPTDRISHVSDRHSAVAFYVARILRPIFTKTMKEIYRLEPYKKDILRSVQQRLTKLRVFLEGLPMLERPQCREPQRMYDSIDESRPRKKAEEEKVELIKLYFLVRRCEEACERLQGDAHRFHANIGAAESRHDWHAWEALTFKEMVVDEKGQKLFYKVHSRLFLNELQTLDNDGAHRLLHLPATGSDTRSTFWGSWVQRRLQAERHLQQAKVKMEQGRPVSEAKEVMRLALIELRELVQRDPAFTHEDLRANCALLIDPCFGFYECYEGFASLCLERIKMLRLGQASRVGVLPVQSQQPSVSEEVEWCYELIGQLVNFLYLERPRVVMKVTERTLPWPSNGLNSGLNSPVDFLPSWFRERHRDDAAELLQMSNVQHRRCATICRSQLLATIFKEQPFDVYDVLHEQLYIWFLENDFSGTQTGSTALQPGLFDLFDYSTSDKRRIQPWFLEQYLERLTSMSEKEAHGSSVPMGVDDATTNFHTAVDTLCTYYERTLQYGKAARKYWRVATSDQPLDLAVRIRFMEKAIAIERRSAAGARRAPEYEVLQTRNMDGPQQATAMVPQAEALSWPKFLQVAQLQLQAVEYFRGQQSAAFTLSSPTQTPGTPGLNANGGLASQIADKLAKHLQSLQEIIVPLRQELERSRRNEQSGSQVAQLLLCCYDAAVAPPEDRQALQPYICQLWAAVIDAGATFDEAMDVAVTLNRDYSLGPSVFTLEDQGGQRGLVYLLERKRYENRAREASVSVVRMAQPGACAVSETHSCVRAGGICASVQPLVDACHVSEERLSRTHYDLITAESDPAFKLHLLAAATAFLVRWQNGVRAAAEAAGSSASARHGLHEQRRRLLAQCAERLAEYRHLCHAATGTSSGLGDDAAATDRSLNQLEEGQRELLELLEV